MRRLGQKRRYGPQVLRPGFEPESKPQHRNTSRPGQPREKTLAK
ncbi:MAG: hypothetical protein P1P72_11175 [ANME-2 cluster archaeon]|nr:hypothetical protein [ANME-2 cluster archaeon]